MSLHAHGWGPRVAGVALALALPAVGWGQTPGGSFGDMPRSVKAGHVVIVTDGAGKKAKGKVVEVSDSSLVILTMGQDNLWTNRETFTPTLVSEVKRTGPIWDGAVKGFVVGVLPPLLLSNGCYDCGLGQIAALTGAMGAGIGLAIDAAFGPKRVYRAPGSRRAGVTVSPVVGRDRKGALLAVRF